MLLLRPCKFIIINLSKASRPNRRLRFGMETPPRLRTKETKTKLLRTKDSGLKAKNSQNFLRLPGTMEAKIWYVGSSKTWDYKPKH